MAALCPGVQYGLSSQSNFGENKDLIFVKLTDSALRAIEDYIRNKNKFSYQTPRIRFLGNENGEFSIPSQSSSNGNVSFNFTMSDTQDMQGPAGSFECIQGGHKTQGLESWGPIPNKLRVHANEDVYEATRNRMNEVEDKNKQKCTREIKPNQTDIGRKVKLKQTPSVMSLSSSSSRIPLVPPQQQQRPPMASMRDSLMKNQPPPTAINGPSYGSSTNGKPSSGSSYGGSSAVHSSSLGGLSNGLGSNHVSSSQRSIGHSSSNNSNSANKPKPSGMHDVARRPLKERLIQLLALRPMKKIELHDRLNKEGVRGGSSMTTILKQIAHMKDNCFVLNRNMWNEVQEDWPFYTETEKQVLKRRKPQNLTPPGSDGSSGSGQSPTSTHPGSPPLITSTNSTSSIKRPGYSEGADGLPYKRQRVAHGVAKYMGSNGVYGSVENGNSYNRQSTITPEPPYRQQADSRESMYNSRSPTVSNRSPIEQNNSQRRPPTDLRDSSNMNPRSRESPTTNGYFSNSNYDSGQMNDDKKRQQCDSLTYGVNRDKIFKSNGSPPFDSSRLMTDEARRGNNHNNHLGSSNTTNQMSPYKSSPQIAVSDSSQSQREKENLRKSSNNVTSSSQNNRVMRVSPDSQTEIATFDINPKIEENELKDDKMDLEGEEDFPDYTKQYVTITNPQQRRNYKTDFNADYAEYRDLHGVVEKVSRRFVQLEEKLRHEEKNSAKWKEIRRQIVKEYQENKKDLEHHRAKKRFTYLHAKLSHIKKLVNDFDQKAIAAC